MGEGGEQEGKSKERRCPYARETVYINPLLLSPPPAPRLQMTSLISSSLSAQVSSFVHSFNKTFNK